MERQVAFAVVTAIRDASADRRHEAGDLLCGGCLYAHAAYPRQLEMKAAVVEDAFARLGRIRLDNRIEVASSPERGYRMRARLHVRDGRAGFYREGTHELCDPAPTGQLSEAAISATQAAIDALEGARCGVAAVELTENIAASERVLHVTAAPGVDVTDDALDAALRAGALTGISGRTHGGTLRTAGVPVVADPVPALTSGRSSSGVLERHAESFFQANRFLLPQVVTAVLDAVPPGEDMLDLYAGVGLFSVSLALTGRRGITAVEGDRISGSDLQRNAAACAGAVRVVIESVEDYFRRRRGPGASTIIVDPPRTGISRDAMQAVASLGAQRIVYVSCDAATMARDARRLLDGGYRLTSLRAFDLFPNTPHVETLGVFDR